jgi:hypothetical protein
MERYLSLETRGAQVEETGSVTFSIRELKAVAALLEVLHLPVSLHFDGAGMCVDASVVHSMNVSLI